VIVRGLEAFFRHKWLILLPIFLIPLVIGPIALLMAASYYEAVAGVFVERPTYLTTTASDFNSYLTPAQNQTNRLSELLRTRSFVMSVASRTRLAPLVGSDRGEEEINRIFFRGFAVVPSGERVLVLRFRSGSPEFSYQMVNAVVEAFKDRLASDRVTQAQVAISFYEGRLKSSQDELDKANEALRRYLAANPRLTTIDPERGAAATTASRLGLPANAIDPQMADLLRQVDLQEKDVEKLRGDLEAARLNASAAIEGQEIGFQVVDPPKMPTRLVRERRKALIYPAAGLFVGAGLSAAMLTLFMFSDRAVRSEADLADIVRVVGTLPRLELDDKHAGRKKAAEATRRAVGFSAGSVLPATTGAS
jgi:uncharacterized protein involved in exopolysaccharide biosynthesis